MYRTAVQTVATQYGYGTRTREITDIAARLDEGQSWDSIHRTLTGYGVDSRTADTLLVRVLEIGPAEEVTTTESVLPIQPHEPFDKQVAADTIRAFLSTSNQGSAHEGRYSDDEVDALLVLAGLEEPAPEPEPVAVVTEDPAEQSIVGRLISWAKGQGFRG